MRSVRRQSRHQLSQVNDNGYYENDYPHYYDNLSSLDGYQTHYHAHPSFFPPPSSRHRSIRYTQEPFSRKNTYSKKRPRSYHETIQGNSYQTGFIDKTITQHSNLQEQQYQYQQPQPNDHLDSQDQDDDDDDDDDEFLTPLEAEALRNAELNKTVHNTTTTATDSIHEATATIKNDSTCSNLELETSATEQQQQHLTMTSDASTGKSFTKKKHDKAFGVLVSFFRRLASTTPHQQKKKAKHSVKKTRQNTKGNIQTMWVSTPLGDVMDQQQQQEVIQMLRQQQTNSHHDDMNNSPINDNQPTPHDDATKVASLDHIWVFRCTDTDNHIESVSTIWTGFDYENQVKLSQHSNDENGIELYDTHIRKGLIPILVLPKRQICFYAAGDISDQVSSLQVACLPNSKNVQFVYRCSPHIPLQSNI